MVSARGRPNPESVRGSAPSHPTEYGPTRLTITYGGNRYDPQPATPVRCVVERIESGSGRIREVVRPGDRRRDPRAERVGGRARGLRRGRLAGCGPGQAGSHGDRGEP